MGGVVFLALGLSACQTDNGDGVSAAVQPSSGAAADTAAAGTQADEDTSVSSGSPSGGQTVSSSDTASAKPPSKTSAKPASKRRTAARSTPSQPASSADSASLDRGTATENAAFVDQGASRTETFPKFVPPVAATTQMDAAEKKAFEKQMAERMKQQEQAGAQEKETSEARQQRIKLLNALAARHSKETIDQIRK